MSSTRRSTTAPAKLACGGGERTNVVLFHKVSKTFFPPFTPYCLGATPESRVPTCVCCNPVVICKACRVLQCKLSYWYYNKRPLSHKLKVVLSGATASPSPPHGGEVPSSGAGQTALTTSSEISSFLVASSRQPCLRRWAASVASLPPARSNCPRPPRPPPHQTPRPSWRPHAPRSSSAPF